MSSTTQSTYKTTEERSAIGKSARTQVPRSSHDEWSDWAGRDPLAVLQLQATTREPRLVPIRYERMAATPFAFYRGAAAVMAADLASLTRTSLKLQICGDAHLVNFGGFASPERDMVFDLNDFDETHPGPFEWDLKRFAASLEVASRARNFTASERTSIVYQGIRKYQQAMLEFSQMHNLDIWYSKLDAESIVRQWGKEAGAELMKRLRQAATKATTKDHLKAMAKLTHTVDGKLRFLSDPPLLVPMSEIERGEYDIEAAIRDSLRAYKRTLQGDRRKFIDDYLFTDLALKVVGVGSVGTRCWVALFIGRDQSDPLFLQLKQAEASVLEPFTGKSKFNNHGQRVVEGQRLMQAASDVLLGWQRVAGPDGLERDFYLRQMWDWKASVDIDVMGPVPMGLYAQMCGWTLARAHARSGDAIALASYLGAKDTFARSLTRFAATYADQNEKDHATLVAAIKSGEIQATAA
jgi:uncharacterized protein (DUF2252 family)